MSGDLFKRINECIVRSFEAYRLWNKQLIETRMGDMDIHTVSYPV